jgi:hypothetical protein
MPESTSTLNTPVLWVNTYLRENISALTGTDMPPFFPSSPTALDALTSSFPNYNGGVMCTWDRLVRMRRSPFPHIKQEQLLYYFYATEVNVTETMVQIQEAVLRLMDREDETAEDINKWAANHGPIDGMACKFKFHRFRVYQLEEVRDIIDFGTARTYGGNKIIIDFEYHQDSDKYEELDGSTPDRPRYNKNVVVEPGILP